MAGRVPPQVWDVVWKQFENDHKERLFFTAFSNPVTIGLIRMLNNFDVKVVAQVRHKPNGPPSTYELDRDHPYLYTEAVELKVFADRKSGQLPIKERIQAEWGSKVYRGVRYRAPSKTAKSTFARAKS